VANQTVLTALSVKLQFITTCDISHFCFDAVGRLSQAANWEGHMTVRQQATWIIAAIVVAFGITAAPALTKSYSLAKSHSWSQPANFSSFGGSIEPAVY
jgi:hypothetical protein